MNLNPFEDVKNEYELEDILQKSKDKWQSFDIKSEYSNIFDNFGYDLLIKSINFRRINYACVTFFIFSSYNNKAEKYKAEK